MPLPGTLARFNRLFTNRFTKPFANRLTGFAVLHHTGRHSGIGYETPLNAWRHEESIVVALTYGPDVDWLKNALAANSTMVMGGETIRVGRPVSLPADHARPILPKSVVRALDLLSVDSYVAFPIIGRPN